MLVERLSSLSVPSSTTNWKLGVPCVSLFILPENFNFLCSTFVRISQTSKSVSGDSMSPIISDDAPWSVLLTTLLLIMLLLMVLLLNALFVSLSESSSLPQNSMAPMPGFTYKEINIQLKLKV